MSVLSPFEGHDVDKSELRLGGTVNVETDDGTEVSIDDRVRLVGDFKVIKVLHTADPKTGALVRTQVLQAINVTLCPWDPTDPMDNGILRARAPKGATP